MKRILSLIATHIWNMSEYYNVPLGMFAPVVFGAMIGANSKQKRLVHGKSNINCKIS